MRGLADLSFNSSLGTFPSCWKDWVLMERGTSVGSDKAQIISMPLISSSHHISPQMCLGAICVFIELRVLSEPQRATDLAYVASSVHLVEASLRRTMIYLFQGLGISGFHREQRCWLRLDSKEDKEEAWDPSGAPVLACFHADTSKQQSGGKSWTRMGLD